MAVTEVEKMSGPRENDLRLVESAAPEKAIPHVEHVDRFGAHEKTDPKEIALVKKLDRWIMVSSSTAITPTISRERFVSDLLAYLFL